MKNFLKSLFGAGNEDAQTAEPPATAASPAPGEPAAVATAAGSELPLDAITRDLVAQICSTMPDPCPAEEIDLHVHMFDAGYVTSISAADLLAHIQMRYGHDISETKLIGPLQTIDALARFIQSPS